MADLGESVEEELNVLEAVPVAGTTAYCVILNLPGAKGKCSFGTLLTDGITFYLGVEEKALLKRLLIAVNETLRKAMEKVGLVQGRKLSKAALFGYYVTFSYNLNKDTARKVVDEELPTDEILGLIVPVLAEFDLTLKSTVYDKLLLKTANFS